MFGFRRFPFRAVALIAIGFLLASVLAGGPAASGVATGFGFALLLPLLFLKMLFVFFLFGALFRFAGGGGRGWETGPGWRRRGRWSSRHDDDYGRSYRWERDPREYDRERWEWEESLRQAKEELRRYDPPYPRPPEGFEPPKPSDPTD